MTDYLGGLNDKQKEAVLHIDGPLMIVAGVAWGVYSLAGRGVANPLQTTAWNFIGTVPLVLVSSLIFYNDIQFSQQGMILAILSGAVASGIGYAIWYRALPLLGAMHAATVQLTVPIIAALGGGFIPAFFSWPAS